MTPALYFAFSLLIDAVAFIGAVFLWYVVVWDLWHVVEKVFS